MTTVKGNKSFIFLSQNGIKNEHQSKLFLETQFFPTFGNSELIDENY